MASGDSGAKVLICDGKRLSLALPCLQHVGVHAIVARTTTHEIQKAQAVAHGHVTSYHEVLEFGMGKPLPTVPPLDPDEVFNVMYTSGSTGNAKGVAQTHRNMTHQLRAAGLNAEVIKQFMQAKGVPAPIQQRGLICPVPLFHVTGLTHIFLATVHVVGKVILMLKWNAGHALELIEREKPTGWTGVPTMVADLMEHADFAKRDTSSLETVGGGGAATPTGQIMKSNEKFKGALPTNGYGLTEVSGGCCFNFGDDWIRKPLSIGRPGVGVEIRTIDPETLQDLAGGKGEVLIRSPLTMKGYWNKEEATKAAFVEVPGYGPGWLRTGDIGTIDEGGFLSITGRAKEIIIRGGENISCVEVEEAFFQTGLVLEAAAFSVPDNRLGEVVGLAVMVKPGSSISPTELRQKVDDSRLLADFKLPRAEHIAIRQEPLLRGATGKIQRRQIREAFIVTLVHQSKL